MGAMSVKYSWFSAKYLRCMDAKAREAGVDVRPDALSAFSAEKLAETADATPTLLVAGPPPPAALAAAGAAALPGTAGGAAIGGLSRSASASGQPGQAPAVRIKPPPVAAGAPQCPFLVMLGHLVWRLSLH